MATSQSGAKRAKAQEVVTQDGDIIGRLYWITEAAAIRRLRRHLSSVGHRLVKTRPGHQQAVMGEYAILDGSGDLVVAHANLAEQLRAHGLMRPDERLDPDPNKGWRFYGAVEMRVMGCPYYHPVTRTYTTERKLRQVFADWHTAGSKVICGYDSRA